MPWASLYPELRMGLYWIPLSTLTVVAFLPQLRRSFTLGLGVLLVGLLAQYAAGFQVYYYTEWRYAAATRAIMAQIHALAPAGGTQPFRVGATWQEASSLNYYRDIFHLNSMAFVEGPMAFVEGNGLDEANCDFYVLMGDDRLVVDRRGLRVLLDDPISATLLAVPATRN